jgi:hypothetical protein
MDLVRSFLFHPLINALWTWGLINKGQTLVIINGGHGLMGGYPLGAIETDDVYKEFD